MKDVSPCPGKIALILPGCGGAHRISDGRSFSNNCLFCPSIYISLLAANIMKSIAVAGLLLIPCSGMLPAQSTHFEDSVLNIMHSTVEDTTLTRLELLLADRFLKEGNYKAVHYYNMAVVTSEDRSNQVSEKFLTSGRIRAFEGLGTAYTNENRLEEALDCYLLLLDLLSGTRDSSAIAEANFLISNTCYKVGEWEMAEKYGRKSLDLRLNSKDTFGIVNSYISIGKILRKQNRLEGILDWHRNAYSLAVRANYTYGIAKLHAAFGSHFLELGKTDSAASHFSQSLALFRQLQDRVEIAHQQFHLADVFAADKKFEKAILFADSALRGALVSHMYSEVHEAYFRRSKIHQLAKNFSEALQDLQKGYDLQDSVENQINERRFQALELHHAFRQEMLSDSIRHAKELQIEKLEQRHIRSISISLAAGMFLLMILAYVLFHSNRGKKLANKTLSDEKKRSDDLLLNILPESVAEELKAEGHYTPKPFNHATVMFTDFKDFSRVSSRMSAEQLVHELDLCFKAFDRIIESFNLEKIKTIGDAYMCVGGVPDEMEDHAERMINAAFEIRDFISDLRFKRNFEGNSGLEIRIGIHSGPLVAGIVGHKKFSYDVWGDTVNTASRLESSSEAGKINISAATANLVKGKFTFRYRGGTQVKNIGEVEMYFVEPLESSGAAGS